jgi:hypothetical protein
MNVKVYEKKTIVTKNVSRGIHNVLKMIPLLRNQDIQDDFYMYVITF